MAPRVARHRHRHHGHIDLLTAWLLKRFTHSALPLADAFTTVFSLWTTWLMVQNHHANWAYWIAIDAVAIVAKARLPFGRAPHLSRDGRGGVVRG